MYSYENKLLFKKILKKLYKKDKKQYEAIINKIKEIINSESVEHYKNLRAPLQHLKRVHIGEKVLVFKYDKKNNMISFENGKENAMVALLLQVLSIGSQMENELRKERQRQGIELRKLKGGGYSGRKPGAKANKDKILDKYKDVVDLIDTKQISLRRISAITNRSVNTVRKVESLIMNA